MVGFGGGLVVLNVLMTGVVVNGIGDGMDGGRIDVVYGRCVWNE